MRSAASSLKSSPSFIPGFQDWKWIVQYATLLHSIAIASPVPSSLILFLSTAIDCYSLFTVRSHYRQANDVLDECILLYCVNPVIHLVSSSLSSSSYALQLLFLLFLLDKAKKQYSLQFLILLLLCFQNPLYLFLFVFRYANFAYWFIAPFLLLLPLPVMTSNPYHAVESNHTLWSVFVHLFWRLCSLCPLHILHHPRDHRDSAPVASSDNGEELGKNAAIHASVHATNWIWKGSSCAPAFHLHSWRERQMASFPHALSIATDPVLSGCTPHHPL